ncbi:MAG: hypothetical protein ACKVS9_14810 [Phycisphaerae bacterium]
MKKKRDPNATRKRVIASAASRPAFAACARKSGQSPAEADPPGVSLGDLAAHRLKAGGRDWSAEADRLRSREFSGYCSKPFAIEHHPRTTAG